MKYLLFAGFLLLACVPLRAQLDNTFSQNGKVVEKFGGFATSGTDMLIQPDQNILVAGAYNDGTSTNFAVMRFFPTGSLDSNFGTRGKVGLPSFGMFIFGPVKVGLQSTKKIVLMGEFGLPNSDREAVLVRLLPNGALDLSFSPTGYLVIPAPVQAYALAIQPDDKILVGGNGGGLGVDVVRYGADGVLDTQFGTNGLATVTGGPIEAMTVDGAGNIVTVGGGNTAFSQVSRFTKNGVPDPHFGNHGIKPINVNGGNDISNLSGVYLQADGNILAVGDFEPLTNNSNSRFLIIRLRPDGTLDPGFAGNGKFGVAFPGFTAFGTGVVQDFQGLIYATGVVEPSGSGKNKFGLIRVSVNGVLDTGFGTDGLFTTGWSGQDAGAAAIAQQSNGKIVVAGSAGADGLAVARYNNPVVGLPPPVVTALDSVSVTGKGAVFGSAAGVRVFPNPVTSMLRVQGLDGQVSTLLLVKDASGKTLITVKVEQQSEYSLDVHRLAAGTYFLELIAGGARESFPFVKVP